MIKVFSFMRSGTHLLMATLYENFDFGYDTSLSVSVQGSNWQDTGSDTAEVPWGKLFGSHDIYSPWFSGYPPHQILYIVRHPVNCIYSLYRGLGTPAHPYNEISFDEWLTDDIIRKWFYHVSQAQKNNLYTIKYEELASEKYSDVLLGIQNHFGLIRKSDEWIKIKKPVGWNPNINKKHKKNISWTAIRKFQENIPDGYLGYSLDDY